MKLNPTVEEAAAWLKEAKASLPKAGEFVVVKTTGPVEPWRPKAKNAELRLALSAAYNTKTFDVTWDAAARTEFAKAAKEALRGFPFLAKIVEKRTTSRGVVLTASRVARVRNETLRATRHLGRTLWKKWSGYHRRSLVETKMRCFKLLGERVMARDFDRQVAELQVRAALLNRFTQLGTPVPERVA